MKTYRYGMGVLVAALTLLVLVGIWLTGGGESAEEEGGVMESAQTEEEAASAAQAEEEAEAVSTALAALVDDFLTAQCVDTQALGIAIVDFESGGSYALNAGAYFTAASTYKLPLAMLYYDKIAAGEIALDDTLYYDASYYEAGGSIGYDYTPGDWISVATLLDLMILESDNTAAHILFENLGGWLAFKEEAAIYSDVADDDSMYYSEENVFTAAYMADVLSYLYNNSDDYDTLLANLLDARPTDYLNAEIGTKMAQKYGQYDTAENAVGLAMSGHPYGIAVYTALGDVGRALIGDLNAVVWAYFNSGE